MKFFRSLLGKYTILAAAVLTLVVLLMTATFYLTEHIHGEGRRINLAGRQRMHLYHVALHLHFLTGATDFSNESRVFHATRAREEINEYERVLFSMADNCRICDLSMILALQHHSLGDQLRTLIELWEQVQKPLFLEIIDATQMPGTDGQDYCLRCHAAVIDNFGRVDGFVSGLAEHNQTVIEQFAAIRIGIASAFLVTVLVIAFFVVRRMVRPVQKLRDATLCLERGEFSCPIPEPTGDEIGDLTRSFARMAGVLESSFRDKEERVHFFQGLIDRIPTPFFYQDLDGILLGCNRAYEEFWGQDRQQIVGQRFDPLTGEEPVEGKMPTRLPEDGQTRELEAVDRRNGEARSLIVARSYYQGLDGRAAGIVGTMFDISDRKRAESELRERSRELKALNELMQVTGGSLSSPELFRLILRETKKILEFDGVRLYLGSDENSLLLKTGLPEPRPEDACPLSAAGCLCTRAAAGGRSIIASNACDGPKCKDLACGFREMGAVLALPLVRRHTLLGVLVLAWQQPVELAPRLAFIEALTAEIAASLQNALLYDAIQRHAEELEKKVRQRTSELEESNRELKFFTASVSHDLQAPVRAVQGLSRAVLEDAADLGPEIEKYLREIGAAADHMETMIGDLLDYSRIAYQEIHLERIDAGLLVETLLRNREQDIRAKAAEVTVCGPLPEVMAHYTTLQQVLTNLLDNGLKFTDGTTPPRVDIRAEKRGGRVRLLVCDNGIGIALRDQQRIFDIFVRLHGMESYAGSGVGLAGVRKGVERMGGSCGVDSEPGRGSTFWIELAAAGPGSGPSTEDDTAGTET